MINGTRGFLNVGQFDVESALVEFGDCLNRQPWIAFGRWDADFCGGLAVAEIRQHTFPVSVVVGNRQIVQLSGYVNGVLFQL